jgi:threonine/homoserine/homoserine lactone efflux protein
MPIDSDLLAFLFQGAALGLAAAATPGPLLAFLVTQTLEGGWRRGMPIALAPLLSDLILVPVILLLLKQLDPRALRVLGLAGGVFILYTAWSLWKSRRSGQAEALLEPQTGLSLRRAVVINFLSPGPYAYWSTVNGPLVMRAWGISIGHAAGFVISFYALFVGTMLAMVLALHFARQKAPRLVSGLMLAGIVILVLFGLLLIYNGLFP